MGQTVFVTGATGVLGRRVVPRLIEAGHSVTAVARSEAKAATVRAAGATPIEVDLFDRVAVHEALAGHDTVVQLATHIPTGADAGTREGWRLNDSLRREAAPAIARAALDAGCARLIQESITFPYVDAAGEWLDEDRARSHNWVTEATVVAEAAAASVTAADAVGIVLRFAMFMAPDSAHTRSTVDAAMRGVFALPGDADSFISFVHVEDAATAVIAALQAPAGTYNVAETDPVRRALHRRALAEAVGRDDLDTPAAVANGNPLARSHRVSSQRLRDVSSWAPTIRCVDRWKELR